MGEFKVLYSENEIQKRINELAKEIDKFYQNEEIIVISVLKGAVFFTVDLVKRMNTPVILDMIQVSSYKGTESTGNIIMKKDLDFDIEGKKVLVVEDIIDTGYTLKYLKEYLESLNPKEVKIAVLLDKKEKRKADIKIDYIGYEIPNKFVVGYGFDIDDKYRNLPYIGYVDN